MRRVISLWLPTFTVDCAVRDARRDARPPGLTAETPFVTVTEGARGVRVAAASPAAQGFGVFPNQPLADARALYPALVTRRVAPEDDAKALSRLAAWARRYTPWTRADALTENGEGTLWMDISGCAHLFGGETDLLDDLDARLSALGFTHRAGLADTPGAAWAAARFFQTETPYALIPDGAARQLLGTLPVAALRLPDEVLDTLKRLGLRDIDSLTALPRAALAARFRTTINRRLDQLYGVLPEPIAPEVEKPPLRVQLPFAEPIGLLDDLRAALGLLLDALCARLEKEALGARRLTVEAFHADGRVSAVTLGTARPTRDAPHLARLFRDRVEDIDAGFGIDLMVLSAPVADPLSAEQNALDRRAAQTETIARLLDRLGARLGPRHLARPMPRPRHVPERAQGWGPPVANPKLDTPWSSDVTGGLRPVRLLSHPVAVAATVDDADRLTAFRWRLVTYTIRRLIGPERISPEWWLGRTPPPVNKVRDYFIAEDTAGRRFWLYARPDLPPVKRWHLHGVFG